ncbi:MAG: hypothetical protein A2174_03245 [Candidatus Portnoybacteria bacterium RBG_13_41_18]|uniref:SCP domain-containing protein n=1 Tax=Candidatus Portnoybacteria bacterium RBG_13_41_18 TaxID=1801991 RepID=A0A1G2F788_9BACT|nr:MAG: hypothetical protein A2174_03245 [Candidatus Portnoybacteria bacterium RBG_13_41_18]
MRKVVIFIVILLLALVGFYFRGNILSLYLKFSNKLPEVERNIGSFVKDIKKEILTPPPLRIEREAPLSILIKGGVLKWTNSERARNNLPPLSENTKLNSSATIKAQDMLKNQYFEHVSPSGVGLADLAKKVSYNYIYIGENLAWGNFESEELLVREWMNSPGHRANILNDKYNEIGIAVLRGTYEGKEGWMAVQEFGLPMPNCPQPDENLKLKIEEYKNQLENLSLTLDARREEITRQKFNSRSEYEEALRGYNLLVSQYNTIFDERKKLMSDYNIQVEQYNLCIGF